MTGNQDNKAAVLSRFATPLIEFDLPNPTALNAELKRLILDRERVDTGAQHSNLGGWQSQPDFASWGGSAGKALLDGARTLADKLARDRAGNPVRVEWAASAWANVNRDGHGNEFHTHPGAFWSASYYVDDGGVADDPALGGEFEIQDPRGVAPAMLAPLLTIAVPGGESMGASELIRPRTGMMLMFPSWLSHGVRPYRGDGVRISVALNLTPVQKTPASPAGRAR